MKQYLDWYITCVGITLSQLLNAAIFLSGHPNESLSGRCWRQRDHWLFGAMCKAIDWFCVTVFDDVGHCANSFRNDRTRAAYLMEKR